MSAPMNPFAFPREPWNVAAGSGDRGELRDIKVAHAGMTLRDFFAAAAMVGYLAAPNDTQEGQTGRTNPEALAEWAYANAYAMLREREKGSRGGA